jgi:hypothetical protein
VTLSMRSLLSAGKKVCSVAAAQLGAQFPDSEEDHREYLCLDVAYQYSLLTKGFNLNPDSQRIELVAKIPFHGEVRSVVAPAAAEIKQRVVVAWALVHEPSLRRSPCPRCCAAEVRGAASSPLTALGILARRRWRRRGRWEMRWR